MVQPGGWGDAGRGWGWRGGGGGEGVVVGAAVFRAARGCRLCWLDLFSLGRQTGRSDGVGRAKVCRTVRAVKYKVFVGVSSFVVVPQRSLN